MSSYDQGKKTSSDGTYYEQPPSNPDNEEEVRVVEESVNSFSKLLDSAIANAAKEVVPDTITDNPFEGSAVVSLGRDKNAKYVYSIETLLELRGLPLVKGFKETITLPEKSFWRSKSKFIGIKDSPHSNKRGGRKHNDFNKKSQEEPWEGRSGFLTANELDDMSKEKISKLLGEPEDEKEPEWKNTDLSEELKLDMGQTVQDFELWKMKMRNEERRKNGEAIEDDTRVTENIEKSSNEVDHFFSFVKPRQGFETSKVDTNRASTPVMSHSENSGRSSRFSSFFSTTPTLTPEANQTKQRQFVNRAIPLSASQEPPIVPVMSGHNMPNPTQNYTASPDALAQRENLQGTSFLPQKNDAFFRSLLNKSESNEKFISPSTADIKNNMPHTPDSFRAVMNEGGQSKHTNNSQSFQGPSFIQGPPPPNMAERMTNMLPQVAPNGTPIPRFMQPPPGFPPYPPHEMHPYNLPPQANFPPFPPQNVPMMQMHQKAPFTSEDPSQTGLTPLDKDKLFQRGH